jgi:hypothetical protein
MPREVEKRNESNGQFVGGGEKRRNPVRKYINSEPVPARSPEFHL